MSVVTNELFVFQDCNGVFRRRTRLTVSGLTAGAANVIPHGLKPTPVEVLYVANSGTPGFETQPADATNRYFTTGAGQTSLTAYEVY